MQDINYFDIVKQALRMTWENKFLWFFGLLILISSFPSGANWNAPGISEKSEGFRSLAEFVRNYPEIFLAVSLAVAVILVALFLLRLAATAALVRSVGDIVVYRQSPVAGILSEARKYIRPLVGLEIIVNVALAAALAVLLVPAAYLFALGVGGLSYVFLSAALFIFIPLAVIAYYLRKFAYFHIILGDMKVRMALESAYSLLRRNIRKSLIMGIVAALSGAGAMAIAASFLLMLATVAVPFGALSYFVFARTGAAVVAVAAMMLATAVLLALFSWYTAFAQAMWALFFRQISLEKQPKEKSTAEKIAAGLKIPSPEAV